jgi:hypothetical protein
VFSAAPARRSITEVQPDEPRDPMSSRSKRQQRSHARPASAQAPEAPIDLPPAVLAAVAATGEFLNRVSGFAPAAAHLASSICGFAGAIAMVLEPLNVPGDIGRRLAATANRAEILQRVLGSAGEVFSRYLNGEGEPAADASPAPEPKGTDETAPTEPRTPTTLN